MSAGAVPNAPQGKIQTIRFARPTNKPTEKITVKPATEATPTTNILHDQLRRFAKRPYCPKLSVAFRLIVLFRVSAAIYSNISDCDEVFNFWEPLHFLDRGYGFQTWEASPAYAIRSWAYIALHVLPARVSSLINLEKRQAFFAVRIALAIVCSFAEAKMYRTVVERVSDRVGRYMLFFIILSTGMWSASSAFLPSSFAMVCNMFAFTYAFEPPSRLKNRRTLLATIFFALGAIVGWPFSLAVAVPFVFEELFVFGNDTVKPEVWAKWVRGRWTRLFQAGLTAALILIPVVGLDSIAYGKLAIIPWNIVRYNVLNADPSRGPELYGTEPWYFYILNLTLNFNIVVPLALASLPALAITRLIDRKRLGPKPTPEQSSPFVLLFIRLAPMYLWLGILSLQPHKEERFMFPIYPLVCFNGAVTLYLMRGWLEVGYITVTGAPYNASKSSLFSNFTRVVVLASMLLSVSRTLALTVYYHAPLDVVFAFQNHELPRLLNATGLLTVPEKDDTGSRYDSEVQIDLSPLVKFGGIRLCLGKEWHRFPGHYLVPDGVQVEFVKSDFDGMLPGHFPSAPGHANPSWWWRPETRIAPTGLNDRNKEELSRYVDVSTCDYLLDSDFSLRQPSALEPRYSVDIDTWERVACHPFLDAANSGSLSRLLWFPGPIWEHGFGAANNFGEFCVLRHKARATARESRSWATS